MTPASLPREGVGWDGRLFRRRWLVANNLGRHFGPIDVQNN